jgi:Flp pilus assembly protein protease CpaA
VMIDFVILACLIWVAIYDIKYHLIRNIDLLVIFVMFIPTLLIGFKYALANLFIYLTMNLLAKRKIGTGDIKLSFICGLQFSSYFQLFNALSITWIIGGFYAILFRRSAVAFAPFMICGTYLARIF